MVGPFEKAYKDLDDSEKLLWEKAAEVLNKGDRLYGQSPDDASQVWWAVGIALSSLREEQATLNDDKPTAVIYLELGVDRDGFFVSPIVISESPETPPAI